MADAPTKKITFEKKKKEGEDCSFWPMRSKKAHTALFLNLRF